MWYLCLLVPLLPVSIFIVVWEEPIRVGAISIGSVMFACSFAFALALGFLLTTAERIQKWVQ